MSRKALSRKALALWLAVLPASLAAGQTPDGIDVADLGGLETRSAALILSGQEAGDLETALLAVPIPGAAADSTETGSARIVLVVDIDGKSLLEGAGGDYLVAEVYAYAVDGDGGLGGVLTQAFRIDLARYRAALAKSGVKFLGHLDLPPGDYSLRILVLHRQSGRLRLRVENLTVAPPRERLLLPPLFPEPAESWLVVRENSTVELPFPRTSGGRAWVPATRPGTTDRAKLFLAGRGLGDGLRAHVVDTETGEALSELGLGDLRPVEDAPAGLEMVAAEIRTAGLTDGRHRLRISSADGTAEASIGLRIGTSGAEQQVLAELEATPVETAEEGTPPIVAKGRRLVELFARTDKAYREALGHLSASATAKAMTTIIDLERTGIGERVGRYTPEVQQQLKGIQATVAAKLVGRRVEGLVAFIALHEKLYRRYHENGHVFLANHTRQVMTGIGDLYLQRSRSPEAERLVASAVASLGSYYHERGARPAALEIYQQALDYDDDHPETLMAKAMLHEAASNYEMAEKLLRKLVSSSPGDRRGKLHLAIVQQRLGAERKAVKLLEECLAAEPSDWITALAFQELAHLDAAEKRPREAIAVLEKAIERMPGEQAFYLQQAALLDRVGEPGKATRVLRRLDARATASAASPRLIYTQPPASHIVRTRRFLDDSVASRRPELAETLSQLMAADEPAATESNPGSP